METGLYGFGYLGKEVDVNHDYLAKQKPMLNGLSTEQKHAVALQAAIATNQLALKAGDDHTNLGKKIAEAYLQAYEAVDGWAKPSNSKQEQDNLTGTIEREGNFFTLRVDGLKKHFISVVHDGSACSFHIPKDA